MFGVELGRHSDFGNTLDHFFEHDSECDSGFARVERKVRAPAKGEVPVLGAGYVVLSGTLKLFWVAIR